MGLVRNVSYGRWEVINQSKNSTKYGIKLTKDMVRGHGYVINIIPEKLPEKWSKRLQIIRDKKINYKLVGAKQTTPRIKAMGRKVWLCNDHIRIFDIKDKSYYQDNSINSRKIAFLEFYRVIEALENKLGISLRPFDIEFKKEHYALIKNDLAIEHNRRGEIMRVSDEKGEWLLIDDSLEMGGELETVGKDALVTNMQMQKWWNKKKENKFKIDDDYIKNNISEVNSILKELSQQNIDLSMTLSQVSNNLIAVSKEVIRLKQSK